jgi:hypothetical protein
LACVPGLQLDVLTVQNPWLDPSGNVDDGFAVGATYHELLALLPSAGWKELRLFSGILDLTPRHMRQLEQTVSKTRISRDEPDFEYTLGRVRPRLGGIYSVDKDGKEIDIDSDDDKAEVAKWWAEHPEEDPKEQFPADMGLEVRVVARRGATATYRQEKGPGRGQYNVGRLLEKMTWVELRADDEWLVDDGVDSPCDHL